MRSVSGRRSDNSSRRSPPSTTPATIHRDVKPSNVLVTEEGRVVLLDFGLIAALAETAAYEDLGQVAGTPAFMAPEQIRGESVGPEADWYAVGVIVYLALTGAFPFDGSAAGNPESEG